MPAALVFGMFLGLLLSNVELRPLQVCAPAVPTFFGNPAVECHVRVFLGVILGIIAIIFMIAAEVFCVRYPGEYFVLGFLQPVIFAWMFCRLVELFHLNYFIASVIVCASYAGTAVFAAMEKK